MKQSFSDLAVAAYCPRKLYYRRRKEDREVPPEVEARRELAFRYEELLGDGATLEEAPLAVPPGEWRRSVRRAREGEWWEAVVDPAERDRLVEGKDCRGVVHKVLDRDGPVPGIVSGGVAPDAGAWEPDAVRAVAAAKALAWEHGAPVGRAVVEYPACGAVRPLELTTRRKAAYRRALRAAETIDGPPPRLRNREKCAACEYREECGVRTRTLGSLLDAVGR